MYESSTADGIRPGCGGRKKQQLVCRPRDLAQVVVAERVYQLFKLRYTEKKKRVKLSKQTTASDSLLVSMPDLQLACHREHCFMLTHTL